MSLETMRFGKMLECYLKRAGWAVVYEEGGYSDSLTVSLFGKDLRFQIDPDPPLSKARELALEFRTTLGRLLDMAENGASLLLPPPAEPEAVGATALPAEEVQSPPPCGGATATSEDDIPF